MGALLAFLLLLALWWQQTCALVTTEVAIESGKVSAPLTLVQLSDLHGATFGGGNRALLSRVERQEPDAVLVTGDMYTRDDERGRATALALLGELAGQYPVYFVPGEHDGEEGFLSALRQRGVTVLDYETAELTDASLNYAPDVYAPLDDPDTSLTVQPALGLTADDADSMLSEAAYTEDLDAVIGEIETFAMESGEEVRSVEVTSEGMVYRYWFIPGDAYCLCVTAQCPEEAAEGHGARMAEMVASIAFAA